MGTNIGAWVEVRTVWMYGALVGAPEVVGAGSETIGTDVRVCVIIGDDVVVVDGVTLEAGTGDVGTTVSLHWPDILRRLVIASSWVL